MAFKGVEFFCAVLLISKNTERLAAFYRDVLGVPLEVEEHDEFHKHYGCELGDIHFAIHPPENFDKEDPRVGSVKLAFEIFDMKAFVEHLSKHNVKTLYPPKDMGTSPITAIKDPDGNLVEFTQLSDGWFKHITKRREAGHDLLTRWKQTRK